MINLTVLGCHSPYAPAKGACSGYLLDIEGFKMMLDCGNGAFSQLQRHMDFAELGLLVLTHLHPDHYCDIYCLRQAIGSAIQSGRRQEKLFVYLPDSPSEIAGEIKGWEDVFCPVSIREAMASDNDFNLFQLGFFPTRHGLETYGVTVSQGEDKLLAYTSDTGWYGTLPQDCQGSKIILAEASLREHEAARLGDKHLTAGQAGRLGQMAGAAEVILTHFFPTHNVHQMQREAEQTFEGTVRTAAMGKVFSIKE